MLSIRACESNCCHGGNTVLPIALSCLNYIFYLWKENHLCASHLPPSTLKTQTDNIALKLHREICKDFHLSSWFLDSPLFDLVQSSMLFVFIKCKKTSAAHPNHHDLWHLPADCHSIYINWTQCIRHTLLITLIYFSS